MASPAITPSAATQILAFSDPVITQYPKLIDLCAAAPLMSPALATPAANQIIYYTSATAVAFTTLSAFARTILDDADAATVRATIGVGTGGTLTTDTDGTLAANSDSRVATQKAVKTYVDTTVTGLLDFKGNLNCSANPNYPSASKGDAYYVSAAGKIGGASGKSVEVGDVAVASADNAGGTEASVGTFWFVLERNLLGAALTSGTLAQFAATTSAQLAGVISDETGTGVLVFATSPTITTPTFLDGATVSSSGSLDFTNDTGLVSRTVSQMYPDAGSDSGSAPFRIISTSQNINGSGKGYDYTIEMGHGITGQGTIGTSYAVFCDTWEQRWWNSSLSRYQAERHIAAIRPAADVVAHGGGSEVRFVTMVYDQTNDKADGLEFSANSIGFLDGDPTHTGTANSFANFQTITGVRFLNMGTTRQYFGADLGAIINVYSATTAPGGTGMVCISMDAPTTDSMGLFISAASGAANFYPIRLNTSTSALSAVVLRQNGNGDVWYNIVAAGTGDCATVYQINGGATWLTAVDNSDGDSFKISVDGTGGAGDFLRIATNGTVRLPAYTTDGFVKFSGTTGTLAVDTTTYLSGTVAVASGGTGRTTSTTAYGLIAAGTTATGAHQTLAAGATTEILVGGGASALPAWTTATGTGAPVRAGSPTLTGTPAVPTATTGTNTTQIASTAFVQQEIAVAVTGLLEFKGATDCSGNPNYPAASKGDGYLVSVAGKIGGASGTSVDVGDWYIATADNAGGTTASVGASWARLEHNLVGALLASNNLSDLANAATAVDNLGGASSTGTGGLVRTTSPTLVTPIIGAATGTSLIVSGLLSAATEFRFNNLSYSRLATADSGGGFGGGYNLDWNDGSPRHDSTGAIAGYGILSGGTLAWYAGGSQTAGTAATARMTLSAIGTLAATAFSGPLTGNVTGNASGSSGSCTGNSATATILATARDINGVSFNGSASITVTAAAGTLTGNTLNSSVVTSSLTTVGTIGTGVWQGTIIGSAYLGTGSSISTKFLRGDNTWQTISGGGDALTSGTLAQFAATTSLELKGVISDETGSGSLVFATSPTLVTPLLGTPTSGVLTNCTGLPQAGTVGLTTADSPQFAGLNIGHATDTTVTRTGAGDIAVEGNAIYRAGGTDVPVTDGGTGSSTAAGAATNLGLGTGDSPQFTALNIGHATDTTITRVSAGVIAVEGVTVCTQGGALGTPASGVATNLTGTAAGLTAGAVTTNANLTGAVTSSGNTTSQIVEADFGLYYAFDSTHPLGAKMAFAGTINQIRGLATTSGTCTVAIKINGTNVTSLSGLSATSTPQDVTATGANTFAVGDRITVVITSSSSPVGLEFTLKATR